jgi:hypothetical protein
MEQVGETKEREKGKEGSSIEEFSILVSTALDNWGSTSVG